MIPTPAGTDKPEPLRRFPPIPIECPHCAAAAELTAVQGDRCPGCHFEFTLFEPGQELVCQAFYEVLTGAKYLRDLPGGGTVVVHG